MTSSYSQDLPTPCMKIGVQGVPPTRKIMKKGREGQEDKCVSYTTEVYLYIYIYICIYIYVLFVLCCVLLVSREAHRLGDAQAQSETRPGVYPLIQKQPGEHDHDAGTPKTTICFHSCSWDPYHMPHHPTQCWQLPNHPMLHQPAQSRQLPNLSLAECGGCQAAKPELGSCETRECRSCQTRVWQLPNLASAAAQLRSPSSAAATRRWAPVKRGRQANTNESK